MNRKLLILILCNAITSVFAFAQHIDSNNKTDDLNKSSPQSREGLNFFPLPDLKYKIDLSRYNMLSLNRMVGNGEGVLAFLDYSDERVVIFDTKMINNENPFQKIGGSIGRGSMNFGNSFDVKFVSKNELMVTDIANARLSSWSTDGKFLGTISMENTIPSRLAVCEDGSLYILLENYTKKGTLAKLDAKTRLPVSVFQKVNRYDFQSILYRDGSLVCLNGEVIYASYYLDFLKRYDSEGNLLYSNELIEKVSTNELLVSGNNELGEFIRRSQTARRSVGELRIYQGYLFVGYSGNTDTYMRRIDIYDPSDGIYLGTIPMKEPFEEFEIDDTGLYILTTENYDSSPYLMRFSWDIEIINMYKEALRLKLSTNRVKP